MRDMLVAALKSYYVGNINKHLSNIEIYLRQPVGVGEHSDIVETIDKDDGVIEYKDISWTKKEFKNLFQLGDIIYVKKNK